MTSKYVMFRVCSVCKTYVGLKVVDTPPADGLCITHTYCNTCKEKALKELNDYAKQKIITGNR